ncbi:MAG: lysophospholipid acyltransferase family protein [Pseudomonadota bacterium]
MSRTLFDTPVISTLFRVFSIVMLKLLGWKVVGRQLLEDAALGRKLVIISAPHTSNWDMPYALMTCFALRIRVRWMGKESLFKPPFRGVMTWLGGIPVDRSQANNLVAATVQRLKDAKELIILVPPEGTRSKVTYWKTGFYWIAHGASVPLLLGYLDFKKKEGGIGGIFNPTGNIELDMPQIRAFYAGISGRNPQNFGC